MKLILRNNGTSDVARKIVSRVALAMVAGAFIATSVLCINPANAGPGRPGGAGDGFDGYTCTTCR